MFIILLVTIAPESQLGVLFSTNDPFGNSVILFLYMCDASVSKYIEDLIQSLFTFFGNRFSYHLDVLGIPLEYLQVFIEFFRNRPYHIPSQNSYAYLG